MAVSRGLLSCWGDQRESSTTPAAWRTGNGLVARGGPTRFLLPLNDLSRGQCVLIERVWWRRKRTVCTFTTVITRAKGLFLHSHYLASGSLVIIVICNNYVLNAY